MLRTVLPGTRGLHQGADPLVDSLIDDMSRFLTTVDNKDPRRRPGDAADYKAEMADAKADDYDATMYDGTIGSK